MESVGERIGEGATADIHAWAPGQVVKLFRAGYPRLFGEHEARMTRAVFAAGAPAPEVFGEVTLEGRFGIVLQRLDGPTLRQVLLSGAMTRGQGGAILASAFRSVHATPPPAALLALRDWFGYASRIPDGIPPHIATGVLALIERLPPGDGVCHADLHPGNLIMTADGPRIIDWAATVRAPGALDLARCHVTLFELVHAREDIDPAGPRALNAAVQSEYAGLAGMPEAALAAAMARYLPVMRAFALAERATNPARRAGLVRRIEASLRLEG